MIDVGSVVIAIPAFALVGVLTWLFVRPCLNKARTAEMDDDSDSMPEPEFVSATVLKKSIAEYKGGSKNPSYKMAFEVLFLTEDGKKMVFEVPEELYAAITEGQSGRLMTIGGNFLDFGE